MQEKPSPFLAAEWTGSELPGASTNRQHGFCALQPDALGNPHTSGRQLGTKRRAQTLFLNLGSTISHSRAPGHIAVLC